MRTLFILCWRNIWRNTRRSLLTLIAITIASTVLLFFDCLHRSGWDSMINATVGIYHGHIQIQAAGYLEDSEIRKSIPNIRLLRQNLESLPQLKNIGARAESFGLVSSEKRAYGIQIVGVEPEKEAGISTIPKQIKTGRFIQPNSRTDAVIGKTLAANLHITEGDEVTILGQGKDGSLAAAVFTIVGLFESGNQDLDRSFMEISLTAFQEVFSMPDEGHFIVIQATNSNAITALQQQVRNKISSLYQNNLVVLSWEKVLPGLKQAAELDYSIGWLFYGSLIIVVIFSILNTFLMAVLERSKEFATLFALGLKPRNVSQMVFIESLLLTIMGMSIGIILGSLIVTYYYYHGFYIPGSENVIREWNLPVIFYPYVSLHPILVVLSIMTVSSIIASLYPASRIYYIDPPSILRES